MFCSVTAVCLFATAKHINFIIIVIIIIFRGRSVSAFLSALNLLDITSNVHIIAMFVALEG